MSDGDQKGRTDTPAPGEAIDDHVSAVEDGSDRGTEGGQGGSPGGGGAPPEVPSDDQGPQHTHHTGPTPSARVGQACTACTLGTCNRGDHQRARDEQFNREYENRAEPPDRSRVHSAAPVGQAPQITRAGVPCHVPECDLDDHTGEHRVLATADESRMDPHQAGLAAACTGCGGLAGTHFPMCPGPRPLPVETPEEAMGRLVAMDNDPTMNWRRMKAALLGALEVQRQAPPLDPRAKYRSVAKFPADEVDQTLPKMPGHRYSAGVLDAEAVVEVGRTAIDPDAESPPAGHECIPECQSGLHAVRFPGLEFEERVRAAGITFLDEGEYREAQVGQGGDSKTRIRKDPQVGQVVQGGPEWSGEDLAPGVRVGHGEAGKGGDGRAPAAPTPEESDALLEEFCPQYGRRRTACPCDGCREDRKGKP